MFMTDVGKVVCPASGCHVYFFRKFMTILHISWCRSGQIFVYFFLWLSWIHDMSNFHHLSDAVVQLQISCTFPAVIQGTFKIPFPLAILNTWHVKFPLPVGHCRTGAISCTFPAVRQGTFRISFPLAILNTWHVIFPLPVKQCSTFATFLHISWCQADQISFIIPLCLACELLSSVL